MITKLLAVATRMSDGKRIEVGTTTDAGGGTGYTVVLPPGSWTVAWEAMARAPGGEPLVYTIPDDPSQPVIIDVLPATASETSPVADE